MGFVYDSFVTEQEFARVDNMNKTEAILYSMVLTRSQMEKYSDITGYDQKNYDLLYSENSDSFDSMVDSYLYGEKTIKRLVKSLKPIAVRLLNTPTTGLRLTTTTTARKTLCSSAFRTATALPPM